ncbi:antiholin-like protein LrgA [Clostridium homopropionicum DSM 5847]|uniref:Antiholin-like protein LrgA n=1 Tax=Clostridium homopropionicum DSM 5847 TaxID=1121318 RepID=A0A0L6Z803_9CLOT|nr:CidA/LrgA family protein [Clostridium homopropionicum]KOA19101.1 antiholin-like protein LrgA [Clostridium homopropionicum DSM 5847]SFG83664.1 holin-like protein [Clostridium homopropionicum]
MKLLGQITIVFGIYFLGELISKTFHLPIPGNVLGMVILLACLYKGIIKVDKIQEISNFLLDNLTFLFLPGGVALISILSILKENLLPIVIICVVSTVIILVSTGAIVQFLIRRGAK